MKVVSDIAKWIVLAAAGVVAVALVVCAVAYVPAVQDFITGKAESYLKTQTGLDLNMRRARLRFPLVLRVDDAVLRGAQGDTLARMGELRVGVAPLPLLGGRVQVRRVRVNDVALNWVDSTMMIKGTLQRLVLDNVRVGMKRQRVQLDRLAVSGADLQMHFEPSTDTVSSTPTEWLLTAQEIDLERINFAMDSLSASLQTAGVTDAVVDLGAGSVDAARVQVSDGRAEYSQIFDITALSLDARRVHTQGSDISATVQSLALNEGRGVGLKQLSGELSMDSAGAHAHDLNLETTGGSRFAVDLVADTAALHGAPTGQFEVRLLAAVEAADVEPFYALPEAMHGKTLDLNIDAKGSLNDLTINSLTAQIIPFATLDMSGTATSLNDIKRTAGELQIDAKATDIEQFFPDIKLPREIALKGTITSKSGSYRPDLHLTADEGHATIRGAFNPQTQRYEAHISAENLPVNMADIGAVTLALEAEGQGLDPRKSKAHAKIDAEIKQAEYRKVQYNDIKLAAALAESKVEAHITSASAQANLKLDAAADLTPRNFEGSIKGSIRNLDLAKLGFSATPFAVQAVIDAKITAAKPTYNVDIKLDSAALTLQNKAILIDRTTLSARADAARTVTTLRSGDIYAVLNARDGLDGLLARGQKIADTLANQLIHRDFRFAQVDSLLPAFNLNMQAGRRNALYRLIENEKMGFGTLLLTASKSDSTSLRSRALATQFYTQSLMLDSLSAGLNIRRGRLAYNIRLANKPGNMEQLAFIRLNGTLEGHLAKANFQQRNRGGQTGFAFGLDAVLSDSTIRASIRPPAERLRRDSIMRARGLMPARTDSLTFAYEPWGVNADNFITWHGGKNIEADIDLQSHAIRAGVTRKVRIVSKGRDIMLGISELDIAKALDLLPAPPPLRGTVNMQAQVDLSGDVLHLNGSLDGRTLVWDNRAIGDVAARIATKNEGGRWLVDASADVNRITAVTVRGSYDAQGVELKIEIPQLPLAAVNPFIPANTAVLTGALTGSLDVEGDLGSPMIDGALNFKDAALRLPMVGTTYRIGDRPIRINDNIVRLRGFALAAPNGRELSASGTFDIDKMTADIGVSGTNFQLVNASRNIGSQIYGTAAVDADVTIRGPVQRLVVRGDIDVLRTTNVTYTMADSAPAGVESQRQEIVTFIAFTDSLAMELQALRQRVRSSELDMQVGVTIEEAARATVNISDNGNDRIELTGGGELALTMNDRGEMRLAGRYALSGGTVVYNPPIPTITQKNFKIRDGSNVNWVGDVGKPQFAITADQTVRTTAEDDGGLKRNVDFTITIDISGTLDAPKIVFDLAAPNDLAIQNGLSSLEPEQRAAQAMALMIYNTYTGPGTTAKVDSNNPVYSFIEKELNQWARNTLRGVDLSLGIRAGEDEAGNKYTNYSYKVSKSLFGDRVKVTVGGSIDNGQNPETNMRDNFVSDVSLEYRLAQWDNLFLKAYRYNTRKSILEGEVIETGGGVLYRKRVARWRDLFKLSRGPEERAARRVVRDQERAIVRDTTFVRDSLRRAEWRRRRDSIRNEESGIRSSRDSLLIKKKE